MLSLPRLDVPNTTPQTVAKLPAMRRVAAKALQHSQKEAAAAYEVGRAALHSSCVCLGPPLKQSRRALIAASAWPADLAAACVQQQPTTLPPASCPLPQAAVRCTAAVQAATASSTAATKQASKQPKQLTAEATVSRLSCLVQQQSSASLLKQRQQQGAQPPQQHTHHHQQQQQQSVLQQQQQRRSSFERRLEHLASKGSNPAMSAGACTASSSSSSSRRPSKPLRSPQAKNLHELFTVWTTTAFYAAV